MNPIICTWSAQLPVGGGLVWPDGCRDLIAIIPTDRPPTVICSGLEGGVRPVVCSEETLFVGVRLAPGVIFPWDKTEPEGMRFDMDYSRHSPSLGLEWHRDDNHEAILQDLVGEIETLAAPAPKWVSNFLGDLWKGSVGSLSCMSDRSFRRQLVRATGAPPRYWSGLVRVRKAGLDICESEAALADVATDNGFSDQAHMNREIRRWFGCTPMKLRANREQVASLLAAPNAFQAPSCLQKCISEIRQWE